MGTTLPSVPTVPGTLFRGSPGAFLRLEFGLPGRGLNWGALRVDWPEDRPGAM